MKAVARACGVNRLSIRGDEYVLRLAFAGEEIREVQELRFEVFNRELNGGLRGAAQHGLDVDVFDAVCDHLIVQERRTGLVVGTYRLQPGLRAMGVPGYYFAREFDVTPYEVMHAELVELGRACVHRNHRNLKVLGLLWRGIADYAIALGARYLIGCSSMHSMDPSEGASAYSELCRRHLVVPHLRTRPLPAWECPMHEVSPVAPELPKLLRAYLTVGARICGPPALDCEFGTIDFLTLLDLAQLPEPVRAKFFGGGPV